MTTEDSYLEYLDEFKATADREYGAFCVWADEGTTDPMTREEWDAEGSRPLGFFEWVEQYEDCPPPSRFSSGVQHEAYEREVRL